MMETGRYISDADVCFSALLFLVAQGLKGETTKVVSPDAGGVYRAKRFRDGLSKLGVDAGLAMIVKVRSSRRGAEKQSNQHDRASILLTRFLPLSLIVCS